MDSGRDSEQTIERGEDLAAHGDERVARGIRASLVIPLVGATLATVALCASVLMLSRPETRDGGGASVAPGTMGATPSRARAPKVLFAELCAQCHGENGDGNGPTELERPARSFLRGGYGYGNTLAVVMRTLEHGIPGTAMPAFGDTISLQERTSLAGYVLSLGPKSRNVPRDAGAVRPGRSEAPRLVQGSAMDPTTGALEPRSVVIGFQGGLTVQYSTSSQEGARGLRAVGIRRVEDWESQGWLRRTDWRGQGGSPLELWGEIAWSAPTELLGHHDFEDAAGRALTPRMRGAATLESGEVSLAFELLDPMGTPVARGHENVRPRGEALVRTLVLEDPGAAVKRTSPLGRSGQVSRGAQVTEIGEGLFCVDPHGAPGTRHYLHAASWQPELVLPTAE